LRVEEDADVSDDPDRGRCARSSTTDDDSVLGTNLDRAAVLDVHDAATNSLPVGQIDEDAVAGSPAGLWLVHIDQHAPVV
jgi:hypothetical protein